MMRNIRNDPRYEPWRKAAIERGYASSMELPLLHEGEVVGALNVYSEVEDAFGEKAAKFLAEVARDNLKGNHFFYCDLNYTLNLHSCNECG
ncbi:GAF domain-containing protein [Chloroflexota bacterium]